MANYSRTLKSKWTLLVLAILVITSGFTMFSRDETARPQEDGTLVLSVEDEISEVSYVIGVDNLANEANGMIEYDQNSRAGIEKFREFNNRELVRVLQNMPAMGSIPARITFSRPLSQAEFTEFADRYDIGVKFYTIYMLEPDGKIATIQGSPSDTELVPGEYFNMTTTSISQEYNDGAEFVGWVEVDGMVPVNRISEMKADQRVYMIDVMQLFLEARLTDEALAAAGVAKSVRQELLRTGFTDIYRAPVAWNLYHLGLMQRESSH